MSKTMAPYDTVQVRQMNDFEFIEILRQFPMKSQWQDGAAFEFAASRLMHMSGKRYLQTGNIKAFTHSIR